MVSGTTNWDTGELRKTLSPKSTIDVMETLMGWNNGEDKLIWPYTKEGVFSVKSGYWSLFDSSINPPNVPTTSYTHSSESWMNILSSGVPERVKEFGWRVKHDALATRSNMYKKRLTKDSRRPICKEYEETLDHLFLLCPWTSTIWFTLQICQVPTVNNTTSMMNWLDQFIHPPNPNYGVFHENSDVMLLTLWNIWKNRNSMAFEGKKP